VKYADLHLHTCFSDGTFTPGELVERTLSAGLSAIAITDHDSVDAINEVTDLSGEKTEIIPGVELTAEMNSGEIHILGYYVDWENTDFQSELKSLQTVRLERVRKMLDKLDKLGMQIDYDDLLKFAGYGSVGRLHIARMMHSLRYIDSVRDAFRCFIGEGKPAYVGKFRLSPKEAIHLIKRFGGVPVLAHPYLLGHDEWISEFIKYGLNGIEVYYSTQNPQITVHYERLAHKNKLLMTGGSDCHGLAKGRVLLGKVKVPYKLVEGLKQARIEQSSP